MRKGPTQELLHGLTRPTVLLIALPWLMLILLAGTLAQKSMGLYEAEKIFFNSFLIWLGPFPLPGIYAVLGLIGVSLLAKLILKSPWTRAGAGTVILHLGALTLLLGGLLTAFFSEEGFVILGRGEQAQAVSDYHARELAILKDGAPLVSIPHTKLEKGQTLEHADMPFTLHILEACRHCTPAARRPAGGSYRGIAKKIEIAPATPRPEDEENQFGATFEIRGAGRKQDGIYLAFQGAVQQPVVTVGGHAYHIVARKAERPLPFAVRLESFKKHTYPGSDIAEEYESVVSIRDGALEWRAAIRMNEPLRYRGYTLYQSSFIERDGEQFSVLAVVKNAGRVFPYISSIVMCIGLLVHLAVRRAVLR